MIILPLIVIGIIIWVLMSHDRHEQIKSVFRDERERRDPIDIIKERYARGEITSEEFDRLKRDLS